MFDYSAGRKSLAGAIHAFPALVTIFTIGHSTRELSELLDLLREYGIATLCDVRRFPGSRRHPHFSRESLEASLSAGGIGYLHLESLGGRRKTSPDSPNLMWRNESFRGYADHMATTTFHTGIAALLDAPQPAAIMCAEAVPWRCHRNMIADELTRRGIEVGHILGAASTQLHTINPGAVDTGQHLIYPAPGQQTLRFS